MAPTALITGASSGIGAGFARRLARDGYHLILVARTEKRLRATADECSRLGAPSVEVIAADLADRERRHTVEERLADTARPVDLLVNNAGLGLGTRFRDATGDRLQFQLDLNVAAVMHLTHAALPGMVDRGRGAIINISSIAGMLPGRGSTYGASKAWVTAFTEGVGMAVRGSGVRMTAVCPGFVRTGFHERAGIDMAGKPGWMYVPVDTVVDDALRALWSGQLVVVPGLLYRLVAGFAKIAPRALVRQAAYLVDRDSRD